MRPSLRGVPVRVKSGVPGIKRGAHVDVFKDGILVSTNRPCPDCGNPLTGLVVNDRGVQRHAKCPKGIERLDSERARYNETTVKDG